MGVLGSLRRVLFVIIVWKAASTDGEALPRDCICPQISTFSQLRVKCTKRALSAFPENIPPETVLLHLHSNSIRHVTYIPPLPELYTLDLSKNLIETVSWGSLCNLPNLRFLEFESNRIRSVGLGVCIARLTKLFTVNLSDNRIASLSERDLGVPHIQARVMLDHNPFRCDCSLLWLITKLRCLQTCGDTDFTCRSADLCDAPFLPSDTDDLLCSSPARFQKRPMSTLSIPSSECESSVLTSTTSKTSTFIPSNDGKGMVRSTRTHGSLQSNHTRAGPTEQRDKPHVTTVQHVESLSPDDTATEDGTVSETVTSRANTSTEIEDASVSSVTSYSGESLIGAADVIGIVLAIFLGSLMLKLIKKRYKI